MTELLTSQGIYRVELKNLIEKVNSGIPVEEVQNEFNQLLDKVGIQEFALIENELLQEGLPREKLEKLCDVHASMIPSFKPQPEKPTDLPGHPVHTFLEENKEIKKLLNNITIDIQNQKIEGKFDKLELLEKIDLLFDIEKHFLRKEMLLFPLLENHSFDGPSKVMWGIHDTIREQLKELFSFLKSTDKGEIDRAQKLFITVKTIIENLLIKEETVLYPTSIQMLTEDEWKKIYDESITYGYCLYVPESEWIIDGTIEDHNLLSLNFGQSDETIQNVIKLTTGALSNDQLSLLFSHLPISMTLIDENDVVKFYSHGQNPIFTRTNVIIGRKVQNCHPPKSLDLVNRILDEFKSDNRDKADFWIKFKDRLVYICFYAMRDKNNNYKGTLEFVQDISYFQTLTGEKRILFQVL